MRTTAGRQGGCWPACSAEMALSISQQLAALGSAALLGLAVGVLYDCFRILRCRLPIPLLAGLLDLLFWLLVTAALFLHALFTEGGVVRFYMVAAVFGGAVLYFQVFSTWFLALGYRLASLVETLLRLLALPAACVYALCKKLRASAKKNFHYDLKWYRIKLIIRGMDEGRPTGGNRRKEGGTYEDKTGRAADQARGPGHAGVRGKRAAQSAHAD